MSDLTWLLWHSDEIVHWEVACKPEHGVDVAMSGIVLPIALCFGWDGRNQKAGEDIHWLMDMKEKFLAKMV